MFWQYCFNERAKVLLLGPDRPAVATAGSSAARRRAQRTAHPQNSSASRSTMPIHDPIPFFDQRIILLKNALVPSVPFPTPSTKIDTGRRRRTAVYINSRSGRMSRRTIASQEQLSSALETQTEGAYESRRTYPWAVLMTKAVGILPPMKSIPAAPPSSAYPSSLLVHCQSVERLANLHGVSTHAPRSRIAQDRKAAQRKGDEYFKAVAVCNGCYYSIYDGETEYILGKLSPTALAKATEVASTSSPRKRKPAAPMCPTRRLLWTTR